MSETPQDPIQRAKSHLEGMVAKWRSDTYLAEAEHRQKIVLFEAAAIEEAMAFEEIEARIWPAIHQLQERLQNPEEPR